MPDGFAPLLRRHRNSRGWSQEHLAHAAGVSPRHLSCLETGKAHPSRDMVLALAGALDLDLRERNALLVGAGFTALYPTTPLDGLAMAHVSRAIDLLLAKQEPYGALLLDRAHNLLRANHGARRLLAAFLDHDRLPAALATNLLRAALHPAGVRPYIVNWPEVAALLLARLERDHHQHPEDPVRRDLLDEVRAYPGVRDLAPAVPTGAAPVPALHLRRGADELRLFTLLTTIGTPLDVTAQDLTLESFFPADDPTDRWFKIQQK